MGMTINDFIDEYYPVDDKIKMYASNPYQKIMDNDDLPCDSIQMVDGKLQKVVYLSDDEVIPVFDLLSYTLADIERINNPDLTTAYKAYMDNIDLTDMTIESIMSAVKDFNTAKESKERLLNKCIS